MNFQVDSTDDTDLSGCPLPTKLRRSVASDWNDALDNEDAVKVPQTGCSIPNWKEITKLPPSLGSYVYNEIYTEEYPNFWIPRQTSVDMEYRTRCGEHDDTDSHHNRQIRSERESSVKQPQEFCIVNPYQTSPTPQPIDASFELEDEMDRKPPAIVPYPGISISKETSIESSFDAEDEMDKKPPAIEYNKKDMYFNGYGDYDDDESIALAPIGPSRRTTAAHDALFSMSSKPVSENATMKSMKNSDAVSQHSVPLTKRHRKNYSSHDGHDSMSYSTDDTYQFQRHLPYLNASLLLKQSSSDSDDDDELLLMIDAMSSPATTIGPDSSSYNNNGSLPSVTPSPNILQQQQQLLIDEHVSKKIGPSSLTLSQSVIRPVPLKSTTGIIPAPLYKSQQSNDSEFLEKVGNLMSPDCHNSVPFNDSTGKNSTEHGHAFQPVMKWNHYREYQSIISDLYVDVPIENEIHSSAFLTTPIRNTPKSQVVSPFQPIPLKRHDNSPFQEIQSGRSMSSRSTPIVRPIPRFTPTPPSLLKSYQNDTMTFSPSEDGMEWEHPLQVIGIKPPPTEYSVHFPELGLEPPLPKEVVVVPTTYMTMKYDKTSINSLKSAPLNIHRPVPVKYSINTNAAMTSIQKIDASQVKTTITSTPKFIANQTINGSKSTTNSSGTIPKSNRHHVPYIPPKPIDVDDWNENQDDNNNIIYHRNDKSMSSFHPLTSSLHKMPLSSLLSLRQQQEQDLALSNFSSELPKNSTKQPIAPLLNNGRMIGKLTNTGSYLRSNNSHSTGSSNSHTSSDDTNESNGNGGSQSSGSKKRTYFDYHRH
jgi:hypothetical protein